MAIRKSKLPKTDSIASLASFWDTHDVTDFDAELQEVAAPVFVRKPTPRAVRNVKATRNAKIARAAINVPLKIHEARTVDRLAQAKGISSQQLVRSWVVQKLARQSSGRAPNRSR